MTEVYYPDLGTPSMRELQFIVSDGATFAEHETEATNQQVQLVDGRAHPVLNFGSHNRPNSVPTNVGSHRSVRAYA